MCKRYRMTAAQIDLARRYGLGPIYPEDATFPLPELFPKRHAWVVRGNLDLGEELAVVRWGFPHTIKEASGKPIEKAVTNVRDLTSQFWRSALKNPMHRCLVPVTAFSEYGPGWWVPSHSTGSTYRHARSSALPASDDSRCMGWCSPSSNAS